MLERRDSRFETTTPMVAFKYDEVFYDDSIFDQVVISSPEPYSSLVISTGSSIDYMNRCKEMKIERVPEPEIIAEDVELCVSQPEHRNYFDEVLSFFFDLCIRSLYYNLLKVYLESFFAPVPFIVDRLDDEKPFLVGIEPNPGPDRAPRRGNYSKKRLKQKNKNKTSNQRNKQLETTMVQRPFPPIQSVQKNSEMVELTYQSASSIFNNPGNNVITEGFNTNSVYDLLPTVLTPTLQFVNYKFSLYKYAKVYSVRFILTFDNVEQLPIDAYYFSSAQSLTGLFGTRTAVNNLAATRKLIWTDTLSEQYGHKSQVIMDKVIHPWMAWGNKQEYFSSNDFACTQTANPPKMTYGAWVLSSPGAVISTGIAVRLSLNIKVLFYDALDIVTILAPPPRSSELTRTSSIDRRA